MSKRLMLAAVLLAGYVRLSSASDVELPKLAGHPRNRFPLLLHVAPHSDPKIDATLRRAVNDWNEVFHKSFDVRAFSWSETTDHSAIDIRLRPPSSPRLMGETNIDVDEDGTIRLPVQIAISPPERRGETPPDVVLYQVAAHELGHALGLPHTADPRSIMCCIRGSVDFSDPATREAYVAARRHPDLRSVTPQLTAHYRSFWKSEAKRQPSSSSARSNIRAADGATDSQIGSSRLPRR